jgi:glyoxylase I family protein
MSVERLMCAMAVRDIPTAQSWYERFFGRSADAIATETEHLWRLCDQGWLYIVLDSINAGHGVVAIEVADLERATSDLNERRIRTGPITREGTDAYKSVVLDPDGNTIALVGVG